METLIIASREENVPTVLKACELMRLEAEVQEPEIQMYSKLIHVEVSGVQTAFLLGRVLEIIESKQTS